MIGYPTSWPGPCQVILPPRSTSTTGRAVERPVGRLGALAGGEHAGVLQQQHGVGLVAGRHGVVQAPLLVPGLAVVHEAGAEHGERWCGHVASLVGAIGRATGSTPGPDPPHQHAAVALRRAEQVGRGGLARRPGTACRPAR